MLETIKRNYSIINKDPHMQELFRFEKFPIHMGTTLKPKKEDLYCDLIYEINTANGLVQIRNLIPEEKLYDEAHYNNIGNGWKEHHKAFADFMAKYSLGTVFEMGGGRGMLSLEYSKIADAKWTILEPVPNPLPECKAHYINGFFDSEYIIEGIYDAIVHTHTLEHFYEPLKCLKNIGKYAKIGSWMFFSVPNMEEILNRCYTNIMSFEHTYYCAEPYITYMCQRSGYKIVERKLYKEDHSVFYSAQKTDCSIMEVDLSTEYFKNFSKFNTWKSRHENIVSHINHNLERVPVDQNVFIFGAHVNTQYLIAFGLNTDKISGILDNDLSKQGKRLYGTSLQVYSPQILRNKQTPIVILRTGTHDKEISGEILKINNTVKFIGE